jgi:hypothetical protein
MFETDYDGTLDKHELAGRLSAREFAAAEYLTVIEARFAAKELNPRGRRRPVKPDALGAVRREVARPLAPAV